MFIDVEKGQRSLFCDGADSDSQSSGSGGRRSGAGRPKKKNSKSEFIGFRVTVDEWFKIQKAAEQGGFASISKYVRHVVLINKDP